MASKSGRQKIKKSFIGRSLTFIMLTEVVIFILLGSTLNCATTSCTYANHAVPVMVWAVLLAFLFNNGYIILSYEGRKRFHLLFLDFIIFMVLLFIVLVPIIIAPAP